MTREKFESIVGYHCSPVLMGLKPSNLVSFSKETDEAIPKLTELYTEKFYKEGIRMEIICSCKKHYLVLVYRPDMLEEYLSSEEVRAILKEDGYPADGSLSQLIGHLKKQFESNGEFPHEIGLFLGYPPEDVRGYRQCKGNDCKMSGYWKVYGDVEYARRLFAQFDRCREFIARQIQNGYSILQVVGMNPENELTVRPEM